MSMLSYEVFLPMAAADGLFIAAEPGSPWWVAESVALSARGDVTFMGGGQEAVRLDALPLPAVARAAQLGTIPVVALSVGGALASRMLPCQVRG